MSGTNVAEKEHNAVIEIQNLGMTYTRNNLEPVTAIEDIHLSASEGEFVSIVGPSGCGKTTLLRLVSGLLTPTKGAVNIHGQPVTGPSRNVGMVFQQPILLEWRSILDNILLPIEVRKENKKDYQEQAMQLLKLSGLDGFGNKSPFELSGGMKQRACICRALIENPAVLLMDEPFGALDAFTRDQMNLELLRIWRGESDAFKDVNHHAKKTIIFITHSIQEAVFLSDRVIVLSARPSKVIKEYKIPFARPRTEEVLKDQEFGELVFQITDDIKANCGQLLYS